MEDVLWNMLALQELVKYQEAAFLNPLEDPVQEHQENVKTVTLSWHVELMDHSKSVSNPSPAIQIVDPPRVPICASTNARKMVDVLQNMLGPFGQDPSLAAAFQKGLVVDAV